MPIRGSTQRRLSFHGLVAITRTRLVAINRNACRKRSYQLVESVEEGCVLLCSGVYWHHASDETHSPLPRKLGNGRARSLHAGLRRGPQCAKAIPQGRGGARLLSISAAADAGVARSPSRDENRNREILPGAFSRNG
jgi:hypothetical protein